MLEDLPTLRESSMGLEEVAVLRWARRAMATEFEIILPFGTRLAQVAAIQTLDLIDDLEAQLTVYRDDSEISQINATAFSREVVVEKNLFRLIEQSSEWTNQTAGAFDVVTGSLVKAWGFYRREGRVPSVAEQAEAMQHSGMRFVVLNRVTQSLRYLRSGLQINLGSVGKGYALDRAAQMSLKPMGIEAALLHGGRSSVRALAAPKGLDRGWPIRLNHPWNAEQKLGTIYLKEAGLGTSAATFQYFEYNGKKLGHVLDPRTGWPASGIEQVSVVAPTAAEADALSTAFFVMGLEATQNYCRHRPEIGAVLLRTGDEQPTIFNLDNDRFTLP